MEQYHVEYIHKSWNQQKVRNFKDERSAVEFCILLRQFFTNVDLKFKIGKGIVMQVLPIGPKPKGQWTVKSKNYLLNGMRPKSNPAF